MIPKDPIRTARDYLIENYRQTLTLETLAREVGYSPFHLQRLFKETYGESPQQLVQRLRLEEARTLICRAQASVYDACLEVGYQSLTTFTTMFGRRFGSSPDRFRRSLVVPGFVEQRLIPSCFRLRFAPAGFRMIQETPRLAVLGK